MTSAETFAAIAHALSSRDADAETTDRFYREEFTRMPVQAREAISDFAIASTDEPSVDDLANLKSKVDGILTTVAHVAPETRTCDF